MKKKQKKGKYAGVKKLKPYTFKQENDIFLGKVLSWSFIMFYPATAWLALVMSWHERVLWLVLGVVTLLFGIYNLMGLIFKWDHARVCTKHIMKKTYKFDIRNAWSKEDTKDSITIIAIFGILGTLCLICSILPF